MDTIQRLRTFLTTAQCGSFTAAADKVALTQAGLGKQMRALELEFQQKLFDKSGRAMVLSAAGRTLVPRVEKLIQEYEDIRRAIRNPDAGIVGSVTIGAIVTVSTLLSKVLLDLKDLHPQLNVHLHLEDSAVSVEGIKRGKFDAAVVVESSVKNFAGLQWTRLYDEPFVFIASSAVANLRSNIEQLLRIHPFVWFDRSSPTGMRIEQMLKRRGLAPRDSIESNSTISIIDLVRQGVGVTVIPLLKCFDWERDPSLCVIRFPGRSGIRHIGMLEPAEGTLKSRVVRERLMQRLVQMKRRD